MKQFILKYAPSFLLEWAKALRKHRRRKKLQEQEQRDIGITQQQLVDDLSFIGLQSGDAVLVHSSLSKIGFVKGGAPTVIAALMEVIGPEGTLLFPTFPAKGRNKSHLEEHPYFDIKKTASQMGSITEYFRRMEGVRRSFHPTDPVAAKGPLAEYFTNSHFGQLTPYNEHSPFRKLCAKGGKILMLGTTLNGACTNLHTLEDAVDFKFPVYDETVFEVEMKNEDGNTSVMKTRVHNPAYSAKRNCDALKPMFEEAGVLVNGKIGAANSMLLDANKMLEVMIRKYNEKGITMYTPYGS